MISSHLRRCSSLSKTAPTKKYLSYATYEKDSWLYRVNPTGLHPGGQPINPNSKTPKHKPPQKRATYLYSILKQEAFEKLKNGRQWPEIWSGDAIEIERKLYMSSEETEKIKGVVIAQSNRFSDTSITILNYEGGSPIIRRLVLYGPTITNIKVLQTGFIMKGKKAGKKVKRAKLYYLIERDPEFYTVV